jgi:hypothetical protein
LRGRPPPSLTAVDTAADGTEEETVGMALLVPTGDAGEPVLGPAVAAQLAGLGVTRVALLGDGDGMGVLLEGWAFDAHLAGAAAAVVFPGASSGVRLLHEVETVAVARNPVWATTTDIEAQGRAGVAPDRRGKNSRRTTQR